MIISVEDLLKGIIVASGNDACIALAEGIAGSEETFAEMMNEKAQEIECIIQILIIRQVLMTLIIIQQ